MIEQRDIRGLMIPVTNGRVLLPNASVAEVIVTFLLGGPSPSPSAVILSTVARPLDTLPTSA